MVEKGYGEWSGKSELVVGLEVVDSFIFIYRYLPIVLTFLFLVYYFVLLWQRGEIE